MKEGMLSISELARLARVTRDTLLYYDKIGLISPVARADNNYRYYSDEQMAQVNLIRTLQAIGMSLREIRETVDHRTPASILRVLEEQTPRIDEKITELTKARTLLTTLKKMIADAAGADEQGIMVRRCAAEPIFLGPPNDYSSGKTPNEALLDFYRYCGEREGSVELNYSAWGYFSRERAKSRDWKWPDRYYLNDPNGRDKKPAGLYAIGYGRGGYGGTARLYERLSDYIDAQGFEIRGPAFEDYPLNELSVGNPDEYLIRVSIRVRRKS
ncbi:MAG: MerR family transcriptional regulator [Clostridiales Family XIII bacterium]|jgi:DNA-binding transcriptional MerR regulator|nr:MerR family transcriptional regulator [Clostridiales Family XIII bacterium]